MLIALERVEAGGALEECRFGGVRRPRAERLESGIENFFFRPGMNLQLPADLSKQFPPPLVLRLPDAIESAEKALHRRVVLLEQLKNGHTPLFAHRLPKENRGLPPIPHFSNHKNGE